MTIVEVIVAAMVLALGAMATFGVLSSATKNTQRAKASQVALNRAQQEIETLRSLENDELALTAAPAHSTSTLSPNYRVSNGTFALIREPPADYANLVVNGGSLFGGGFVEGAAVDPGPTPFTSGDVSGKVYRYVVWRNDASCPAATCPGTQDYKQIVVAVRLDKLANQTAERGYVEVASRTSSTRPTAPSTTRSPVPTASSPASSSTSPTLRAQRAGRPRARTSSPTTCSTTPSGPARAGLRTEATPGAPDALLTGVPPDPATSTTYQPGALRLLRRLLPRADPRHRQRRADPSATPPAAATTSRSAPPIPESQVHRWVTDPMTVEFKMTEKVTLEFYTRTLNDESYNGDTLRLPLQTATKADRSSPPTPDRPNRPGNAYWTYNRRRAPAGGGGNMGQGAVDDDLQRQPVYDSRPATASASRSASSAPKRRRDAIPIMYDHPKYPTRLEVDTTTPIDGG